MQFIVLFACARVFGVDSAVRGLESSESDSRSIGGCVRRLGGAMQAPAASDGISRKWNQTAANQAFVSRPQIIIGASEGRIEMPDRFRRRNPVSSALTSSTIERRAPDRAAAEQDKPK